MKLILVMKMETSLLQKAINKRGLKAKVERVKAYHNAELDSSCKIIKKIKKMDFKGKINDNCD